MRSLPIGDLRQLPRLFDKNRFPCAGQRRSIAPVNLLLPVPDDLALRLAADGSDIARRALEAFAVAEYRAARLTDSELCRLLGLPGRLALDAFLKDRGVYLDYGESDLERDRSDLARFGS